ncbi:MAG TPA: hypothetical protein VG165_07925 [Solirubrobacteraceae bacterium]|jgi:hypothetical protein|nr:hypothetical protein [Solirubrobacteraceae bacterium]
MTPSGRRPRLESAAWWVVRPAQNRKPTTYTCPLCGRLLPALTEHMLLIPEGQAARRRHAHTVCVLRARKAGRLPLRDEAEPRGPGLWSRITGLRRRR